MTEPKEASAQQDGAISADEEKGAVAAPNPVAEGEDLIQIGPTDV